MKDIALKVLIPILIIVGCFSAYQMYKLQKVTDERDLYWRNTSALMEEMQTYVVRDSLNVSTVQALELSLKEIKKYRSEDMWLIEELEIDRKRL